MKYIFKVLVVLHIIYFQNALTSFIYGQPCSVRNTAYLSVSTWKLPLADSSTCVDITGFKKHLLTRANMSQYEDFFQKVRLADTLYSDHMNLTRFPIGVVKKLPKLQLIDLSGNRIKRIPNKMIRLAPNLEKLMLSDNKVMVPKRKPLMASLTLKTLMLSNNGIGKVYKFTFAKLPALEVLYLDSNNLRSVAPMFGVMPNLKYLHLGRNYLVTIPPREMIGRSLSHYITKNQRRDIRRRSSWN